MKALLTLAILMMTACSHTWTASNQFDYEQGREKQEAQFLASLHEDNDHDGVSDYWDQCIATPIRVKVNSQGCALDRNGNGLPDFQETAEPVEVEADTSQPLVQGGMVLLERLQGFALENEMMTVEMQESFDALVTQINRSTDIIAIELTGHTDDTGSASFNYELSGKRAQKLADKLQGVLRSDIQIMVRAMGELQPIADNTQDDGRVKNRRVEIHALYKK